MTNWKVPEWALQRIDWPRETLEFVEKMNARTAHEDFQKELEERGEKDNEDFGPRFIGQPYLDLFDHSFYAYEGLERFCIFDWVDCGLDLSRRIAMNATKVRIDGLLTFWTTNKWNSLDRLSEIFTSHELKSYCPQQRSPLSRLHAALRMNWPSCLIRPLKGTKGFEVVKEISNGTQNTYEHVTSAGIDEDGEVVALDTVFPIPREMIIEAFEAEADKVHGSCVSKAIMFVVANEWEGLSLRPAGGIYWVPSKHGSALEAFAIDLAKSGNELYGLKHEASERAVKAVLDAFTTEIESSLEEMKAKEGGPRARRNQARKVRERIAAYEEHLFQSLPVLRQHVNEVEEELLAAALEDIVDQPSLFEVGA